MSMADWDNLDEETRALFETYTAAVERVIAASQGTPEWEEAMEGLRQTRRTYQTAKANMKKERLNVTTKDE